jgi:hypothetical protein
MEDVVSIKMFDDADLFIMRSFIKSKEHGCCNDCGSFLVDARILVSSIYDFLTNFIDEKEQDSYGECGLFWVDKRILISSIYDFMRNFDAYKYMDEDEKEIKLVVINPFLIDLLYWVLLEIFEPEPDYDETTDWPKLNRENKWRECEYFTWWEDEPSYFKSFWVLFYNDKTCKCFPKKKARTVNDDSC